MKTALLGYFHVKYQKQQGKVTKTVDDVLCESTHTLPRQSLLSKCHTVPQYTRKCIFIYTYKKTYSLHCVYFHETHNYWTASRTEFTHPLKKCGNYRYKFTLPIFMKLALIRQLFVKKSCTEFHENLTVGLVKGRRTEGHGLHNTRYFSCVPNNT